MNKSNINDLHEKVEIYDVILSNLDYPASIIQNKVFENCKFINANFRETKFIGCKFADCDFKSCNLSACQFDDSTFREIIFYESKILGINWTKLKWPFIKLSSPFQFYQSDISHSSFYGLDLKEVIIEQCKAHDVDFRGADLTNASLTMTDFDRSQFVHTNLCQADFIEAINYRIDPNENHIRKAKFSIPDVINLLHGFDIEIQ